MCRFSTPLPYGPLSLASGMLLIVSLENCRATNKCQHHGSRFGLETWYRVLQLGVKRILVSVWALTVA